MRAASAVVYALLATACRFEVVPPAGGPGAPDAAALPEPIDAAPAPDTGPDASQLACGDGVVGAGEDCDDGNADPTDACVSCAWARCGDGQVRAAVEQCDDGNTVFGDACSGCLGCGAGDANEVWDGNGHCYSWFAALRDWDDAVAECAGQGGHLATIGGIGEEIVAAVLIQAGGDTWIGYSDRDDEGVYASVIGDGAGLELWAPGQPDDFEGIEDCVNLRADGDWNDLECAMAVSYLCEDDGWTLRDDDRHAYKVFYVPLGYQGAVDACAAMGGHLVSIEDAGEGELVDGLVGAGVRAWIGLDDRATEGSFAWVTGEPLAFTDFYPGEPNGAGPNQDCVAVGYFDARWTDDNCGDPLAFVCELE